MFFVNEKVSNGQETNIPVLTRVVCSAIGNAYSVLSDATKRQRYDQYGAEEDRPSRQHSRFYEYDYSRGFEGVCVYVKEQCVCVCVYVCVCVCVCVCECEERL